MTSTPAIDDMHGDLSFPNDICVISSYFNPCSYRSKLLNFLRFREHLERVGAPLFVIEMSSMDGKYEVELGSTKRVKACSTMWQKERLLNILIRDLPRQFTKVVWADCDILFERDDWLRLTSTALDKCHVVQPFNTVLRLARGQTSPSNGARGYLGFCWTFTLAPHLIRSGWFQRHGHTGFAWAGRRDWLEAHGLYDVCLSGSGDHLMAHAFCGDWTSPCITRTFQTADSYYSHFAEWATAIHGFIGGRVGFVEGRILHLWHGDTKNRNYLERDKDLALAGFNPRSDLVPNTDGCWEFTTDKLVRWSHNYFAERREDDTCIEELV